MNKTVLVVGGAGVFGSRLVERLAASTECAILVAGRSLTKAQRLIASLSARRLPASLQPLQLDRERVTAEQLRATGAFVVVDAAGPFQGSELRLARAAIAAGCHFIDLADARDYVAQFPSLDAAARAQSVLAACGVSTTPALSHAVLDEMAAEFGTPSEVVIAVTPGNRAPRGLAVVQAIASYVGRPVRVLERGVLRLRAGWSLLHRRGLHGLERRWFCLCETPDLDLVPQRFPKVRTVHFFAGLELSVLHLGLWGLGWLVRLRLLRSLASYAALLHAVAQRCERFGADRGGMQVEGTFWNTRGHCIRARWELLAEAGDGPYVPTCAALALLRRLLAGTESRRGAIACAGLLSLAEILRETAGLAIRTQRWTDRSESLFQRVLGADFEQMPAPLRALHSPRGPVVFRGAADIEGATSALTRVLARCLRFPAAAQQVTVEVAIVPHSRGETWRRRFGAHRFSSVLQCARAGEPATERFGPVRCTLRVVADQHGLRIDIIAAHLGPLPLPRWLTPWTRAGEHADEHGRFNFDVEIGLPGVGRLVHYRGWLEEASSL